MAPPPFESPPAPTGSMGSSLMSANTRLIEPRETGGPTGTGQQRTEQISNPEGWIAARVDTASRFIQGDIKGHSQKSPLPRATAALLPPALPTYGSWRAASWSPLVVVTLSSLSRTFCSLGRGPTLCG